MFIFCTKAVFLLSHAFGILLTGDICKRNKVKQFNRKMTVEQVQKLTQKTQQVLKERCNETYCLYRVTVVSAQQ